MELQDTGTESPPTSLHDSTLDRRGLPAGGRSQHDSSVPGHRGHDVQGVRAVSVPARPIRWMTICLATAACVLTGWQTTRAVDGQEWSAPMATASFACAVGSALGILLWTWIVVENGRRLLAPARSERPPDPVAAVIAWLPPMIIAVGAAASVVYLQSRLHQDVSGEASPLPLAVAGLALVATLLMAYRPLFVLSGVTRRLGGRAVEMAKMFWAPVALLVVGSASLVVLRAGGAYGEGFEGIAPAWALGAMAIPPAVIVLILAWRGAREVENAVDAAFDRRNGEITVGIGRGRMSVTTRLLRADAGPPIQRDTSRRIRLVPGVDILRLAVVVALAALAMLSIVGAIVMFLFWREASDGALLQSQETRAWNALDALQRIEHLFALGLLGVGTLWTLVNVMNARLASGRRRNPILAAAAWPAAAYGIWRIGDRFGEDERVAVVVGGFALQAVVLYVPFFLLERAATAVGARRQPLRVSYGLGVILLVQTQGLAGLSTLDSGVASEQFGRLAGYLALTALVELLSALTITEASRLISDASSHDAQRHNRLADQRRDIERRAGDRMLATPLSATSTGHVETFAPPPRTTPAASARPAGFAPPPPPTPTVIAASSPPSTT